MRNPNGLDFATRQRLKKIDWRNPHNIIDLDAEGIRYFDPELLPTWIPLHVHRALYVKGWCPPNALPIWFPENQGELTEAWLHQNYFRMKRNSIHYIGNEPNFQPAENFDKKPLRICFGRLSEYEVLEGGFGQYLIANFVEDFDDRVFFDYAFAPPPADYAKLIEGNIPLMTGVISKRPLRDFDIVLFGITIAEERLHLPMLLARSGVAIYRYQRFDQSSPHYANPIISMGGIGALFSENILGDHPKHGPAMAGLADIVQLGEGELLNLKFAQRMIQYRQQGKNKTDLLNDLDADHHCGVYNPARVVFEYHDKVVTDRDFEGNQVGEKRIYPGAGPIKQISLIDPVKKQRHIMAGPGNSAYTELEAMQQRFIANFQNVDGEEVGEKYVRVDKRPTREERRRQFQKINGETAALTNARFSVARARAEAIAEGIEDVQGYIVQRQREFAEENKESNLSLMLPRDAFMTELDKAPQARSDKRRTTLIDTVNRRVQIGHTAKAKP